MIRTILKYVGIGMVLLLVLAWAWGGGYRGVIEYVRTVPNPINILLGGGTGSYEITLPWQISPPMGADIELLLAEGNYGASTEERLAELQSEYDRLSAEAAHANRSPHYGAVVISPGNATAPDAEAEYATLSAAFGAHGNVSLDGWSIMSAVSGARVAIPYASSVYEHGAVNRIGPVVLSPGDTAIVSTGISPVNVSYRENRCLGYIASSLRGDLSLACPALEETLALTDQNLQRYGAECIDYVRGIRGCMTPSSIPLSLPTACRIYIANTFSYQGCVDAMRAEPDFAGGTWRLYIGLSRELWQNTHDALYLLDEESKVVDAVIY